MLVPSVYWTTPSLRASTAPRSSAGRGQGEGRAEEADEEAGEGAAAERPGGRASAPRMTWMTKRPRHRTAAMAAVAPISLASAGDRRSRVVAESICCHSHVVALVRPQPK